MPRSLSSNKYSNMASNEKKLHSQIRNWAILVTAVLLIGFGIYAIRHVRAPSEITAHQLPCEASQNITPFGDGVLYYNGASIICVRSNGATLWTLPVGAGAQFSVSDTNLVVWAGSRLFIVDRNGRPSYNENQIAEVQFARIGSRYCAAVVGDDTSPTLVIRALDGTSIDEETEAYSGLMLLDCGFYGEADQYLWTLSMDVYGTAINTILNTFQVGKMNTGIVSLGEFLAYKVLYEGNQLRVFTTQQMYSFDYKGVQNMADTRLVYGWSFLDAYLPERGSAYMLLARYPKNTVANVISELRVLSGSMDRRYTLPRACLGAAIQGKNLYALSSDHLYRADVDKQSFYGYRLPLKKEVTGFFGLTSDGYALVAAGNSVYSIRLPG